MIGTGRVWGTSASSAPSVTTDLDAERSATSSDGVCRRCASGVGLDAADQQQVALGARGAAGDDRCSRASRPRGCCPSAMLDRRPGGLEVVELLGVDLGDQLGARATRRRRRARCVAALGGVVPAREAATRTGDRSCGGSRPRRSAPSSSVARAPVAVRRPAARDRPVDAASATMRRPPIRARVRAPERSPSCSPGRPLRGPVRRALARTG